MTEWGGAMIKVSLGADVYGPLAIHDSINGDGAITVTHRATGYSLTKGFVLADFDVYDRSAIVDVVERLVDGNPDLDAILQELSTDPPMKRKLAISKQVVEVIKAASPIVTKETP